MQSLMDARLSGDGAGLSQLLTERTKQHKVALRTACTNDRPAEIAAAPSLADRLREQRQQPTSTADRARAHMDANKPPTPTAVSVETPKSYGDAPPSLTEAIKRSRS